MKECYKSSLKNKTRQYVQSMLIQLSKEQQIPAEDRPALPSDRTIEKILRITMQQMLLQQM